MRTVRAAAALPTGIDDPGARPPAPAFGIPGGATPSKRITFPGVPSFGALLLSTATYRLPRASKVGKLGADSSSATTSVVLSASTRRMRPLSAGPSFSNAPNSVT